MTTDRARIIYADIHAYLLQVKERISDQKPFVIAPALSLLEEIVDHSGSLHLFFPLMMRSLLEQNYMISHQANTAFFTLKIGGSFHYSRIKLIELGLCALLHDVGMFTIDDGIVNKTGPLTADEFNLIRTHSEVGWKLLAPLGEAYPFLPEVVYQHHERENGQGYPRGLRGKEIHEYANIISIIDCYEAMTNQRPNRKALMQCFSAKELVAQSKGSLFPARIIKAFLSEITLYPVGSYVRLNSSVICEVIATNPQYPLRPDVKVILDMEGNPTIDEKIINLRDTPHFFILDCVELNALPETP
jgi:HD-GYP domain-containing protein (c-di-GMP phosphodiesterase class II)